MRVMWWMLSVLALAGCSISIGGTTEESGDHLLTEDALREMFATLAPTTEVEVDCRPEIEAREDGLVIPCTVVIEGRTVPYERVTNLEQDEVWPVGHNVVAGIQMEQVVAAELGLTATCPELQVVVVGEPAVCPTVDGGEVSVTFADDQGTIADISGPGGSTGAAATGEDAPEPLRGA